MKITVKNIHQQTFTVEIDASRKVRELKILLANNIPEYPANSQYIIYAGRIMHDEQILGNYNFDSSRFLVVMNRPPIQHQMNESTLQNLATPVRPIHETRPMEEIPVRDKDEEISRPTEASGGSERDYIITGTEKYIEVCRSLIDMGYPDRDVELAMSKAFNNPERAVEYLLQGSLQPKIPQTKQPAQRPESSQTTTTPMQTSEPNSQPKTGSLDFLKTQPLFLQLRRVVHDNHHLLPAVMKKIEDTNPSLLKLITDNKEEFIRILNEDNLEPGRSLHTLPMPGATAAGNEAEQMRQTPLPPSQPPQPPQQSARTTITVTTQEKEAIERLKALGFSEHLVLQAYFACDKNELQAADFLLSQDDDVETL